MVTREENLKKINDELEKLNDDDLKKIACGTCGETADDSRFLNVLLQGTKYYHCDRYGEATIFFSPASAYDVTRAWRSLGIDYYYTTTGDNEYSMNGQKISRYTAWNYAQDLVGRYLSQKDWDW